MRNALCRIILSLLLLGAAILPAAASSAAAPPPPTPVAGKPGTVTVLSNGITYYAQAGDTLTSIAQRYTSRSDHWAELGKINRINRDVSIPIGAAILIPTELLGDDAINAQVVALAGQVRARVAGGHDRMLAIGATLEEGVEIDTGPNSFLTIALPDSTRIAVPSNSRVKLARLRATRYTGSPRTEVVLLRGRIESRVAPLDAIKGKFEVRTPHTVAGVRGTRFRVGLLDNATATTVLSGRVAVGKTAADTRVLVPATGNISSAAAVAPAVDLLPAPRIVAPESGTLYRAAQVALVPLAGAAAYHVQISTDQDAQNVIAESRASAPYVTLGGVHDGDYFMHVSAIDRAGLQGLVASAPFRLRRRAAAAGAPYIERSDYASVTLRWNMPPDSKAHLQVARDPDFSWLIHSATTDAAQATLPRPPFGTYYARVQIVSADGSTTSFSTVQPFIVTDQWVLNDGTPSGVRDAQLRPVPSAPSSR